MAELPVLAQVLVTIVAAATEAAFGYLLEESGIVDRFLFDLTPAKRSFRTALKQSLLRFERTEYGGLTAVLFDEHFLSDKALGGGIIARCLLRVNRPTAEELIKAWAEYFGESRQRSLGQVNLEAASVFLQIFEEELQKQSEFAAIYQALDIQRSEQHLSRIATDVEEIRALFRQAAASFFTAVNTILKPDPDLEDRQYLRELRNRRLENHVTSIFGLAQHALNQGWQAELAPTLLELEGKTRRSTQSSYILSRLTVVSDSDSASATSIDKPFTIAFEDNNRRVLLLGAPGSGKTTSLVHFMKERASIWLDNPRSLLPVFIPLEQWRGETPLIDWFAKNIDTLKKEDLERALEREELLLLLDGLDEIQSLPDETDDGEYERDLRIRFIKEIEKLDHIPIVVACREKDYDDIVHESGTMINLRGAVRMQPLTHQQVKEFLQTTSQLWPIIRSDEELIELLRTPLILSLFAAAYRDVSEQARDLYNLTASEVPNRIFSTFISNGYKYQNERAHASSKQLPITLDEVYALLGEASFHILGNYGVSQSKGLDLEFFSRKLGNQASKTVELLESMRLIRRNSSDRLSFSHGLLRTHFALPYCLNLLDSPDKTLKQRAAVALSSLRDPRAVKSLGRILLEDTDHETRAICASSLGFIGDSSAIPYLLQALEQYNSLVTLKNIILSLSHLNATDAIPILSRFLTHANQQLYEYTVLALAHIQDQRCIPYLINAIKSDRLPLFIKAKTVRILGYRRDSHVAPVLISAAKDSSDTVREPAVKALGYIFDIRAVPTLSEIALKDNVMGIREAAILGLRNYQHPLCFTTLRSLLGDSNHNMQLRVIGVLGGMAGDRMLSQQQIDEVSQLIVTIFRSGNTKVRAFCAGALGQFSSKYAYEMLVVALHDAQKDVRRNAAGSLGDFEHPSLIDHLIARSFEQDPEIRRKCLFALKKQDRTQVVDALNEIILQGTTPICQRLALLSDSIKDIEPLLAILKSSEHDKDIVSDFLSSIERSTTKPISFSLIPTEILISQLDDPDSTIRRWSAEALGHRKDRNPVAALLRVIQTDPDLVVRSEAASSLGRLKALEALPYMLEGLQSPNLDLRRRSIKALGRLKDRTAAPALIKCLQNDTDEESKLRAISALGGLNDSRAIPVLEEASRHSSPKLAAAARISLDKLKKGLIKK